jgi:hypothetical protein
MPFWQGVIMPNESDENYGRPVQNAANEVALAATAARAMLSELQAGWLWQLLIKKPIKD